MSDATTAERRPPTLADIVREKTDDGRLIIDFFLDVMEARVDGAELCHRMDAAKQLVKYGSKDAARFIARYRGVPCGHSTRGRPNPADSCSGVEGSPAAEPLNAPGPFSEDLLTVLSAVDEDLMVRLVRAQTADGGTVIEFLDDVMQDRNEGFKCHHRIAAAKELIVHIVRDEQREPVPGDTSVSVSAQAPSSVRAEPVLSTVEEPVLSLTKEPDEGTEPNSIVVPAGAGTYPLNAERNSTVVPTAGSIVVPGPSAVVPAEAPTSAHPEPSEGTDPDDPAHTAVVPAAGSIVIPAEAGTHPRPRQARPEPAEGPQNTARPPRRRRTRTQRRRDGAARAGTLRKGSERNKEENQDKPAPVELTPAERRIRERLEQHWHEPDPYGAPIDSAHPGRSPPWVTATWPHN